ncbi:hypothetical protein [Aliivibrio kagoshimensis]|uniref:hypothetical protein n=1 Tax=Aliivibrio kagoshimensis TaxID=2910230 RepID=UPI003D0EFCED
MRNNELTQEWQILQNQYDSYEKYSLLMKLFNIALFSVAWLIEGVNVVTLLVLLVVWLQDAIWKTFQSRIDDRLVQLEVALSDETAIRTMPFQYNREYAQNRPSTIGLIASYLSQAVRPTVAFPHVVLVMIGAVIVVPVS